MRRSRVRFPSPAPLNPAHFVRWDLASPMGISPVPNAFRRFLVPLRGTVELLSSPVWSRRSSSTRRPFRPALCGTSPAPMRFSTLAACRPVSWSPSGRRSSCFRALFGPDTTLHGTYPSGRCCSGTSPAPLNPAHFVCSDFFTDFSCFSASLPDEDLRSIHG